MRQHSNFNAKKTKKNNSRLTAVIIAFVVIVIIILLLIKACGNGSHSSLGTGNPPTIDDPYGTFEIYDTQQPKQTEDKVGFDEEVPTITFSGYGTYSVTDKNPSVELRNPSVNFVDMVFTLIDVKSGKMIARTGKVAPGKFLYVNMVDFYKEKGSYKVQVLTSTYHTETGEQMNGMNQEMEIVYK